VQEILLRSESLSHLGSISGTNRWLRNVSRKPAVDLPAKVPHARIILNGSADELPLCTAIERKDKCDRSRVADLAGKTAP
jgi:hypothetical protein